MLEDQLKKYIPNLEEYLEIGYTAEQIDKLIQKEQFQGDYVLTYGEAAVQVSVEILEEARLQREESLNNET
jgi:hypothetical protein